MKINRNYRFVLAVLDSEKINTGEIRIDNCAVTGERMPANATIMSKKYFGMPERGRQEKWPERLLRPYILHL